MIVSISTLGMPKECFTEYLDKVNDVIWITDNVKPPIQIMNLPAHLSVMMGSIKDINLDNMTADFTFINESLNENVNPDSIIIFPNALSGISMVEGIRILTNPKILGFSLHYIGEDRRNKIIGSTSECSIIKVPIAYTYTKLERHHFERFIEINSVNSRILWAESSIRFHRNSRYTKVSMHAMITDIDLDNMIAELLVYGRPAKKDLYLVPSITLITEPSDSSLNIGEINSLIVREAYDMYTVKILDPNNQMDVEFSEAYDKDNDITTSDFLEGDSMFGIVMKSYHRDKPNKIVGCCTLGYADCEPELASTPYFTDDDMILSCVYIEEESRGKALALRMIEGVLDLANKRNCNIFAYILEDWLESYYAKIGFVRAFEDRDDILVLRAREAD